MIANSNAKHRHTQTRMHGTYICVMSHDIQISFRANIEIDAPLSSVQLKPRSISDRSPKISANESRKKEKLAKWNFLSVFIGL